MHLMGCRESHSVTTLCKNIVVVLNNAGCAVIVL